MMLTKIGLNKIKPKLIVKKVHQWLALLIGLQLLLWLITGLSFGLLDATKINGTSLLNKPEKTVWQGESDDFKKILQSMPQLSSIESKLLLAKPVYLVTENKKTKLLDANNLQPIIINHTLINRVADQAYAGNAEIIHTELLHQQVDETRDFKLPVWQVKFNDSENSALYIDAETAKVLKLKTDTWRLFDLFWMLHIMDYSGMSDFNNSLVIFAALVLCFFVFSGFMLIFSVFSREDFIGFNSLKAKSKMQLQVTTKDNSSYHFDVEPKQQLIYALAEQNIILPSTCGGGGGCGRCWIKTETDRPVSEEEANLFKPSQLKKGIRLACQQRMTANMTITVATANQEQTTNQITNAQSS
jgi:Na+-transporting NADH:ubiquinone oxidoreductase subunit F